MKTITLLCVLFLGLHFRLVAQNETLDKVFDSYAGREGYTTVYLSPGLLFSLFTDDHSDKFNLKTVKILFREDSVRGNDFYEEIIPNLRHSQYQEMMRTRSGHSRSIMLYRKDHDRITDFLYVSGGDDNVLFYLAGSLPLSSLHKISEVAAESTRSDKQTRLNE